MGLGNKWRAISKGIKAAKEVRQLHNIPITRQILEWRALRRNNVGIEDYYYYRLYDPRLHPNFADKLTYTGWRAFRGEFRRFANIRHEAIAYEKHILYRVCEGMGLPVPQVYAIYAPTYDSFERNRALATKEQLHNFLARTHRLPFFGKPSNASQGTGACGVLSRELNGDFKLLNGQIVTLDALTSELDGIAVDHGTYLITELLQNDPAIQQIAGNTLCSFRVVMLVRDGEPEFFRTSLRLPGPSTHVSNVVRFERGTISCRIDPETGELTLVLAGAGADRREIADHPVSGLRILGRRIERWQALRQLAIEASRAMSPFRMQHWDFALTSRGPVILEMNVIGDVTACQVHGPPGVYTEQYLSFRDSHSCQE